MGGQLNAYLTDISMKVFDQYINSNCNIFEVCRRLLQFCPPGRHAVYYGVIQQLPSLPTIHI